MSKIWARSAATDFIYLPSLGTSVYKKTSAICYKKTAGGCFICTSHRPGSAGYPRVRHGGKLMLLHRFVYEREYGEIPKGMCVCHKCDNRLCFNPKHLFLGTIADNNLDMRSKGRGKLPPIYSGVDSASALFDAKDIREIRSLAKVLPQKTIIEALGVSKSTIHNIVNKRSYKDII